MLEIRVVAVQLLHPPRKLIIYVLLSNIRPGNMALFWMQKKKNKAAFVRSPAWKRLLVQHKGTEPAWNPTLESEKSVMLPGKIMKDQGLGQCLVRTCSNDALHPRRSEGISHHQSLWFNSLSLYLMLQCMVRGVLKLKTEVIIGLIP